MYARIPFAARTAYFAKCLAITLMPSLDEVVLAEPADDFDLRWRNQPRGTERDDLDRQSFHLMLREPSGGVVGSRSAEWR